MIIVQLTDLHVRPYGRAAYRTAETNMLTERALWAVRNLAFTPDAIVISGDLTNNGLASEYAVLSDMLSRIIKVPVYVLPGNHDHRETMRSSLGHLPGVTSDPYFIQYAVDHHDVRLVMLDTVIPGSGAGELCEKRLAWLDATLSAEPNKPTLVVMHHPPFACGIRHMDHISLQNPSEFISIIAKHSQVKRILCGHHHRPINAAVAHTICSIAPSVAHQVEFVLGDEPGMWKLEPPAFEVFVSLGDDAIVGHTIYVENYPGPYPFFADPVEDEVGRL